MTALCLIRVQEEADDYVGRRLAHLLIIEGLALNPGRKVFSPPALNTKRDNVDGAPQSRDSPAKKKGSGSIGSIRKSSSSRNEQARGARHQKQQIGIGSMILNFVCFVCYFFFNLSTSTKLTCISYLFVR